jgi:ketosteroid isomerase-like protein
MNSIIHNLYQAFDQLDAETMVSYYHKNIIFEDPAFGVLKGDRVKNMWRMLCLSQKKKKFNVIASNITVNENNGSAHWEAHYVFSKTGRKVHNKIDVTFEFKDGKIIKHTDYFNLHNWAKQALGFKGYLIGGTSFFKRKLNAQTNRLLTKFENK